MRGVSCVPHGQTSLTVPPVKMDLGVEGGGFYFSFVGDFYGYGAVGWGVVGFGVGFGVWFVGVGQAAGGATYYYCFG